MTPPTRRGTLRGLGALAIAANVRHILGRRGEVSLPESGTEHISVIRGQP